MIIVVVVVENAVVVFVALVVIPDVLDNIREGSDESCFKWENCVLLSLSFVSWGDHLMSCQIFFTDGFFAIVCRLFKSSLLFCLHLHLWHSGTFCLNFP